MTHEIKFRAWDKGHQKMSQPFDLFESDDYLSDGPLKFLNNVEVMQFTGLLDKNGKEIYEGDMLAGFSETSGPLEVQWFDGSFELHFHKSANAAYHRHCAQISSNETNLMEVIGNVHENAELVK